MARIVLIFRVNDNPHCINDTEQSRRYDVSKVRFYKQYVVALIIHSVISLFSNVSFYGNKWSFPLHNTIDIYRKGIYYSTRYLARGTCLYKLHDNIYCSMIIVILLCTTHSVIQNAEHDKVSPALTFTGDLFLQLRFICIKCRNDCNLINLICLCMIPM